MFTLILLAIYTLAILLFVPLDRIGKVQIKVRSTVKRWLGKIGD